MNYKPISTITTAPDMPNDAKLLGFSDIDGSFLVPATALVGINDTTTVSDKTWSSEKINTELTSINNEVNDLSELLSSSTTKFDGLIDDNTVSLSNTYSSSKIVSMLGHDKDDSSPVDLTSSPYNIKPTEYVTINHFYVQRYGREVYFNMKLTFKHRPGDYGVYIITGLPSKYTPTTDINAAIPVVGIVNAHEDILVNGVISISDAGIISIKENAFVANTVLSTSGKYLL